MDKRKIVVKNLPGCTQDTLENFLEVVCDNGVVTDGVKYYDDRTKHIAIMVTMDEDVNDIGRCQKNAKKRPLEGNTVELLPVALPSGVMVTDLPSNITEDTLQFYFENRRSGGEDEGVKACTLYDNLGLAVVVFKNHSIVEKVLKKSPHKPIKDKSAVTVEPYYAEFHADVLDYLDKMSPSESMAGGDNPMDDQMEEPPLQRATSNPSIKNKSPGPKSPPGNQKFENFPTSPADPSMVSVCGKKSSDMISVFGGEDFSMVSLSGSSERAQAEELDDSQLFQSKEVKRSFVPEPAQCVEARQTSARVPPPVPQKPKRVASPPAPPVQERRIESSVTFSTASAKLLKASRKIEKEFPTCELTYNLGPGKISFEGPETKVQEVKLRLYEENQKISSCSHPVPSTIADIMIKDAGKQHVDKEFNANGNSLWYLENNTVFCVSFSDSETHDMIGCVKRLIQQEYVSYDESHYQYQKSSEWFDFRQGLERDQLVKVAVEKGKHKIKIDGLGKDVGSCKQRIEKELKKHSHKSGSYSLSGAKAKCLKHCFMQEIADIKKPFSDKSGRWDESGSLNSIHLTLNGAPDAVKKIEAALKSLEKKVWHEKVVLGKDVAKDKELNLLIRGLLRSNLKTVQAGFEAQHSVFLELNLPGVKKPVDMPTGGATAAAYSSKPMSRAWSHEDVSTSLDDETEEMLIFPSYRASQRMPSPRQHSPPRRPLSTSVTFGNITVNVKKGDITKEKADVLVNVVPTSLDLTGTVVSQAFQRAGGPPFQLQYEVGKGNWSAGAVIQTKSCGNLQAQMIYTIAIDKWNPPGSKTELKDLIGTCLKTAAGKGYSSIAMSSVGCGKLFKFPEKYVASCLVNTVKSNSGLINLKQVNMVLFDQKTYQIFLNEINPSRSAGPSHAPSHAPSTQSDTVSVGGTNITVQQGDITKFKATILVNVITEDLDLGTTAVSCAFARAGGPDLLKDFKKQKDSPPLNNIIVTIGGNLNCRFVYHVVLKKSHSGATKGYQNIVKDCFKLAGGYNTQSIAFPAIGCGMLFKYKPDFVASCLLSEATSSSISNVTFVIYDQPVLNTFLQELQNNGVNDGSSENLRTLRKYAKSSKADQVPTTDNQSANIVIYGPNQKTCNSAKVALNKQLKDEYLYSEIIKNENLTCLADKTLNSFKTDADRNGIWIKFPDPDNKKKRDKPELKLKGERNAVLLVTSKIQKHLMTVISQSVNRPLRSARGTRGSMQHLQDMAAMSEFPSPSYWTYFKAKQSLKDIIKEIFTGPTATPSHKLVDVDTATYNAIDTVVQQTWDALNVGNGNDAAGLTHKSIKVKKIQRLEHPEMFTKYCQRRGNRFHDACNNKNPFTPIGKLPGSKSAAFTTKFASAELQREVYPEVNEHYLFHGTKIDNLQAILSHGLDSRVGNTQAMFGPGVYGAESSTKADQYTDDKGKRTPGDKQMVLMRMTLGHPYVCGDPNPKKYCRPPCKDLTHLDDKCNKPQHGIFHSVIGDGKWLFREFVVYEHDLCYPEYIITYTRV